MRTAEAVKTLLKSSGLRPTRQRQALGELLFTCADRHVTAESLHDEARRAGISVSVATVYNTLHQFTEAGLLSEVVIDGSKIHFDTNTSAHHHFLFDDGALIDIPVGKVQVSGMPQPPEGTTIERVDILIRLAKAKR